MKRPFQALVLGACLAGAASALTLEELQTSFMTRYDEANSKRDDSLKKLESGYLGALQRYQEKVQKSGRLEAVVPVRAEIEAIRTGTEPLPELPDNVAYEFKQLRTKYVDARDAAVEEHAKTLVDLAAKMDDALEGQEADLTKAGKIDQALAAKRMRETLAGDAGVKAAKERLEAETSVPAEDEWIPLLDARMKVDEARFYVGPIDGEGFGGLHPKAQEMYRRTDDGTKQLLVCPAPAKVDFSFPRRVNSLRGEVHLMLVGDAVCRVIVAGKTVWEHDFKGALNTSKKISCEFPETSRVTIEVEGKGSHAWTAFSNARCR